MYKQAWLTIILGVVQPLQCFCTTSVLHLSSRSFLFCPPNESVMSTDKTAESTRSSGSATPGGSATPATPGGSATSSQWLCYCYCCYCKQLSLLLLAINNLQIEKMDDKLAEFHAEMRKGQEDTATRVLKHARLQDKPYQGNEEQAKFNEKVDEILRQVKMELEDGTASVAPSPGVTEALKAVEEGMNLIAKRQNSSKLQTDWSSAGV